jgi:uncharacterized protein
MKVQVQELRPGYNPLPFTIPEAVLHGIVQDADLLYFARSGGASVDFTIEKLDEVLMLRGTISATVGFECASCLAEQERPLAVTLHWTLLPKTYLAGSGVSKEEEVELTTDDLDVSFFEGEEINLGELAREAILLELDPAPRCGLDTCGRLAYPTAPSEDAASAASVDPRWAPLLALRDRLPPGQN